MDCFTILLSKVFALKVECEYGRLDIVHKILCLFMPWKRRVYIASKANNNAENYVYGQLMFSLTKFRVDKQIHFVLAVIISG